MHELEKSGHEEVFCFFIGTPYDFSDSLLNLARSNLPHTGFTRLDSVNTLLDKLTVSPDKVRCIIFTQSSADPLHASLQLLHKKFPEAIVALAYRKAKLAQKVLASVEMTPLGAKLAFLPMNRDVDCWLTLLQLLVFGENYIPSECYGDSKAQHPTASEAPEPSADTASQKMLKPLEPILERAGGRLTPREIEVLTCVAEGKQNKIIATSLGLSEHTVKLHIHHVISKLGVHNRTEAAVWLLGQAKPELGT